MPRTMDEITQDMRKVEAELDNAVAEGNTQEKQSLLAERLALRQETTAVTQMELQERAAAAAAAAGGGAAAAGGAGPTPPGASGLSEGPSGVGGGAAAAGATAAGGQAGADATSGLRRPAVSYLSYPTPFGTKYIEIKSQPPPQLSWWAMVLVAIPPLAILFGFLSLVGFVVVPAIERRPQVKDFINTSGNIAKNVLALLGILYASGWR